MDVFPFLSTGVVAQYPASRTTNYLVERIEFVDGSDQRCLIRGRRLRRWQVPLNLLTETELQQIEEFFLDRQGQFATFSFPDPITGEIVPNCRLANGELLQQYMAERNAGVSMVIEETNA